MNMGIERIRRDVATEIEVIGPMEMEIRGGDKARQFIFRRVCGGVAYSFVIIETVFGIVIMGDYEPKDGPCTARKSVEWFAGENYPDYLASHILERKFIKDKAIESLKEDAEYAQKDLQDEDYAKLCLETVSRLREVDTDYDALTILSEEFCELPGFGYDHHEVVKLYTIYTIFKEHFGG